MRICQAGGNHRIVSQPHAMTNAFIFELLAVQARLSLLLACTMFSILNANKLHVQNAISYMRTGAQCTCLQSSTFTIKQPLQWSPFSHTPTHTGRVQLRVTRMATLQDWKCLKRVDQKPHQAAQKTFSYQLSPIHLQLPVSKLCSFSKIPQSPTFLESKPFQRRIKQTLSSTSTQT